MSKTGSYRYIDGEWVKVSDRPPRLVDAYVPEGGYIDETLGDKVDMPGGTGWRPAHITSKEQKAAILKKRGLVEDGGYTAPKKRIYVDMRTES